MKKKFFVVIAIIVVLVILLTPVRMNLKDGGSVRYKALVYEVTKIHRLAPEVDGAKPYIGRLEKSYGYGKQIGTQSLDGKVRWRLDYDEKIGVHYNIEDFSNGKSMKEIKKVIPIDISYDEYKSIIALWN